MEQFTDLQGRKVDLSPSKVGGSAFPGLLPEAITYKDDTLVLPQQSGIRLIMLDTQTALTGGAATSDLDAAKLNLTSAADSQSDRCLAWKIVLDYALSSVLLLSLAVPMLVIAFLIKYDSPGPVFFRQPRIGKSNDVFLIWKFRTMHQGDADLKGSKLTERHDPRITRVGTWLRRLSIDELPQLLNVLAGEMSLVGPRPHALEASVEGRLYADLVPDYQLRHRIKPGMTGWAQINGWRGETVTIKQIEERVRHDLEYLQHQSLAFDVFIIIRTIRALNDRNIF